MHLRETNRRILFGLKVRHRRQQLALSPAALAKLAGMSVSYLNEIEKGKKYPKDNKLASLATALAVSPASLASLESDQSLAPLVRLLQSNFLNELPLDLFGIELSKVVEIIAESPLRVGAFISTMVDLAQSYAIHESNFYEAALTSFQELHNNFFPDIEQYIEDFSKQYHLDSKRQVSKEYLQSILTDEFGISIKSIPKQVQPSLSRVRAIYQTDKRILYLNTDMSERLTAAQLARELGFQYMQLKERVATTPVLSINSFEQMLNQFRSTYFSAGIMVQKEHLLMDIKQLFGSEVWDAEAFNEMVNSYNVTPETLFLRMSQLLLPAFGLKDVFFFRIIHDRHTGLFHLDRELQLGFQKQQQYRSGLNLHYCRRWQGIELLKVDQEMAAQAHDSPNMVAVQKSKFFETGQEYLTISWLQKDADRPHLNSCISVHLRINDQLKQVIRFTNDPSLQTRVVNSVCETCPIADCNVRAVPAHLYEQRKKRRETIRAVNQLLKMQE